jgi:hypothetical protein
LQGRSASGSHRLGKHGFCLALLLLVGTVAHSQPAHAASLIQSFDFAATEADGEPSWQAGAHPEQVETTIAFTGKDENGEPSSPRNLTFDLPPGMIGSPTATPTCRGLEFQAEGTCPPDSQIGYVRLVTADNVMGYPIFNLEPLPGALGEFGFSPERPVRLALEVHAGQEYRLSITTENIIEAVRLEKVDMILWGVPADSRHDGLRGHCLDPEGEPTGELCPSEAPPRPLLTNPSTCQPSLSLTLLVESWQDPGVIESATASNRDSGGQPIGIEGCESLTFRPTLTVSPSVPTPLTPTGLALELHAPQAESANSPAEPPLEDVSVTLPVGVAISPPAAAGLGACAADQIRLGDDSQPSCPDASKLGTVTIETPMIAAPLRGWVYLARPGENPFASRFAIYAVVAVDGALIKLAGRVDPDPVTGQLRASFDDLPQLAFSEVEIALFNGPRAPLATPSRCGTYTSASELTAWGTRAAATPSSAFQLTSGCSEPAFAPVLRAGTLDPAAGSYSPLVLRLERGDRDAEFASSLSLALPGGVSAALAGTASCPQAELLENGSAQPGCPDSSRIGNAVVGAGVGSKPLYLTGAVYLAGPYRGAPFSLAAVVPARAGPFDLGTIVERIAVDVDPRGGRLTARADGLPHIRAGVPLQLRSFTLELDRPGFIRNPTSCEPTTITGTASNGRGQSASLSQPFQVGGCSRLAFKPRLSLRVLSGVGRGGHPALRAVLRTGSREAAIAGATIGVPGGELLDLRHLGTMCAQGVAPERCPASSRLGSARVWSPLIGEPLLGSIYLRAPSGRLPGLSVDLRGGGFHFVLGGRVVTAGGSLGIRLSGLPDLPLEKAVFTLAGGRRGLLVNSEALCAQQRRAKASLRGHNGALRGLRPVVRPRGGC